MTAFQSIDPSFAKLIGPNAQLRRILRDPQGQALFHEAGVLVDAEKGDEAVVVITSNRLPCPESGQKAGIVHLPVAALPGFKSGNEGHHRNGQPHLGKETFVDFSGAPETDCLRSAMSFIVDFDDAPLAMPNGGCPHRLSDGTGGALLCEQGHHGRSADRDVHAALVEWSPRTRTAKVLLDKDAQGRRFASLNDIAVHQQSGSIFFTDPRYGIEQGFKRACPSQGEMYAPSGLYVRDPRTGSPLLLDDRYDKPNGVTFVPDPREPSSGRGLLMTTDTGRFRFERETRDTFDCHDLGRLCVDGTRPAKIYAYRVDPAVDHESLPTIHVESRMHFADSQAGVPDGIHHDEQGNVWVGHGDGVHIYRPRWSSISSAQEATECSAGDLIGKIILPPPRGVANFCWAGAVASPDGSPLYRVLLFAEDELWEALVAVNGFD